MSLVTGFCHIHLCMRCGLVRRINEKSNQIKTKKNAPLGNISTQFVVFGLHQPLKKTNASLAATCLTMFTVSFLCLLAV